MPITRRIRAREDDDETEEVPEARQGGRTHEEEDEDEPRPRARRAATDDDDDDDDAPRARRRRDDDDDDDDNEDARPKGGGSVRKGWGGYRENKSKSPSDFPEELKISGEPELVKFLEDEPFVSYRQHWIDNPPVEITKKRSWICIEDDCPLCDMGDRPRLYTGFNVLHLSTGGEPANKILLLGQKATGQLENFAADPKTGPLTKHYYALSKSGKQQSTAYNFRPVKERDLEEDWEVEPLTKAEIAAAIEKVYDETAIHVPTRKQLRELAKALSDED